MNVYITGGTEAYLENIKKEHPSKAMVLMTNKNGALLLDETSSASVFDEPQRYDVVETYGEIQKGTMVVMDYIPVSDEGRPLFEQKFNDLVKAISNQTGLNGVRFLRPSTTNTYLVLTAWENARDFEVWKQSDHYFMKGDAKAWYPQPHIFESSPYESIYTISD